MIALVITIICYHYVKVVCKRKLITGFVFVWLVLIKTHNCFDYLLS